MVRSSEALFQRTSWLPTPESRLAEWRVAPCRPGVARTAGDRRSSAPWTLWWTDPVVRQERDTVAGYVHWLVIFVSGIPTPGGLQLPVKFGFRRSRSARTLGEILGVGKRRLSGSLEAECVVKLG